MMVAKPSPLGSRSTLSGAFGSVSYYNLGALAAQGAPNVDRLPFTVRILLENLLRQSAAGSVGEEDVLDMARWSPARPEEREFSFMPARVLMQDLTGVPSVVDLAAMRSAVARLGGDPKKINPLVPVDLVIDHSVQVDFFATADSLQRNAEMEFQRNRERYEFLKWGQKAFSNFRVVPPSTGIIHQVNLEYLAQVVLTRKEASGSSEVLFPDTLIGTDSHTTM